MKRGLTLPGSNSRRALAYLVIALSLTALLSVTSASQVFAACGGGTVTEPPPKSKQINIVMDDSGSMFWDGKRSLDRWSFAKYSLEAFAALMNREDTVNVYLMSGFRNGATPSTPALQLNGRAPSQERVQQVRNLQLAGGGTPYAPVEKAQSDLQSSSADEKWLVILTDGNFQEPKLSASQVQGKLKNYVAAGTKVAALAIGANADQIPATKGIYSFKAESSRDLLNRMNDMANLIFERSAQQLSASGGSFVWPTDVNTRDVYVFAQGENVEIKGAKTSTGTVRPDSSVKVQWSTNPKVQYVGNQLVEAVPEKSLNGVLATFKKLPKGNISFDIPNSDALVQVIFKPNVEFNAIVRDQSGKEVSGKLRAGTYTIDYGFLNEKCEITKSNLIGDVTYLATVTQNGEVVASNIPSGGKVELGAGDITIEAKASYLKNLTSSASINFGVQEAKSRLLLENEPKTFKASKLKKFGDAASSIVGNLTVSEGEPGRQVKRSFTPEEWAAFNPEANQIDEESGLQLQVSKGDQIGQLKINPRAIDEDVYGVKTGDLQVPIQLPALNDGNRPSMAPVAMTVDNDISPLKRFWNWLKKWLPLLLLIALLLGYIFKPRFVTRGRLAIKRRPRINGSPMQIGQPAFSGPGKFEINQTRRFLPFVADTATVTYVPSGVMKFPKMKVKAARQKRIILMNWKQIAANANTAINGTPLDATTTRPPVLRASTNIRATDPAMTYDMTLNIN